MHQRSQTLLTVSLGLAGVLCLAVAAAMVVFIVGDDGRSDRGEENRSPSVAVETPEALASPEGSSATRETGERVSEADVAVPDETASSVNPDPGQPADPAHAARDPLAPAGDAPASDPRVPAALAVPASIAQPLPPPTPADSVPSASRRHDWVGFASPRSPRSSPAAEAAAAPTEPAGTPRETENGPESETGSESENEIAPSDPDADPPSPPAGEPETPEAPQTPVVTDSPHRGQPVVDYIIGNSDSDPRQRMVGWAIVTKGWAHFVRHNAEPYFAVGVKRMILHNPFGTLPDEHMQLDQYLNALDQHGLRMLTHGFAKAWRPITDRGIEVIAYVGCPRLDADSKRIDKEEGREAALDYGIRSLQPFLDANMSIALDAAAPAPMGSLTWALAEQLRTRGVVVYVEARPWASNPHWFDYGVISTDPFWKRSNPEDHRDSRWGARNDQITGEILRMLVHNREPPGFEGTRTDFQFQEAHKIQGDGHTPIFMGGREAPPARVGEFINIYHMASFD